MARSLSGAKIMSALVLDALSFSRPRYAAASQGAVSGRTGASTARVGKEEIGRSSENAWVPDHDTGYYRPANRPNEIDVAELQETLLKQRLKPQ